MNHSLFEMERQVLHSIERIARERGSADPVAGPERSTAAFRERIGRALIAMGERVGGPAVRSPRPIAGQPNRSPLFGF